MTEQLDQWYRIKFCQKLGDSQVETIWKIQRVFSDDAMGITQNKGWYNQFKDGRTSMGSDARSGRPSTSRNDELIDRVWTLVMQDCRVTVRELVEEVGISTGSVHSILTNDLALWTVSAKFVPKLLMMEQKQLCLEVTQDILDSANSDPKFLNIVTTGDESWVYGYDLETKEQPSFSQKRTMRCTLRIHSHSYTGCT